ncbi:MAG: hypothetical protein DDT20_01517 [Firmicutes bacterium]|nr:hypothetical protein [Bacillota bacterium]
MHMLAKLFLHIVVGVGEVNRKALCAVHPVKVLPNCRKPCLARLENGAGVVAHNILKLGLLGGATHLVQVIEPLVVFSVHGPLCRGQHGVKLHSHKYRITHFIL